MAKPFQILVWLVFSCVQAVYWLPVVIVTVALVWGYYVYVYLVNIAAAGEGDFLEKPVALRVVLLLFGHILVFLLYASYFKSISTKHAPVPAKFRLTDQQLDELDNADDENEYLNTIARELPIYTVSEHGNVRYCKRCRLLKPDRAHHCSLCGRCVLKMDHHCPWVNNCVGYSNYKYFFLFLFYTVALCLYTILTSVYDVTLAWRNFKSTNNDSTEHSSMESDHSFHRMWIRFNLVFLFFMCIVFAFGAGFLFFFHTYLVLRNKTTLESGRSPEFLAQYCPKDGFSLGWKRNLQEVFGTRLLYAFLPIDTSLGNGWEYPLAHQRTGGRSPEDPVAMQSASSHQPPSGDEYSEEEIFSQENTPLTAN